METWLKDDLLERYKCHRAAADRRFIEGPLHEACVAALAPALAGDRARDASPLLRACMVRHVDGKDAPDMCARHRVATDALRTTLHLCGGDGKDACSALMLNALPGGGLRLDGIVSEQMIALPLKGCFTRVEASYRSGGSVLMRSKVPRAGDPPLPLKRLAFSLMLNGATRCTVVVDAAGPGEPSGNCWGANPPRWEVAMWHKALLEALDAANTQQALWPPEPPSL